MLKEAIPEEVQQMVVNSRFLSSDEAKEILPPKFVQEALMMELGLFRSPAKDLPERAEKWVRAQRDYQDRATKAYTRLQQAEPFSPEIADSASIPLWAVKSWASTLHFEWSDKLPDAVEQAEEYLKTHAR